MINTFTYLGYTAQPSAKAKVGQATGIILVLPLPLSLPLFRRTLECFAQLKNPFSDLSYEKKSEVVSVGRRKP